MSESFTFTYGISCTNFIRFIPYLTIVTSMTFCEFRYNFWSIIYFTSQTISSNYFGSLTNTLIQTFAIINKIQNDNPLECNFSPDSFVFHEPNAFDIFKNLFIFPVQAQKLIRMTIDAKNKNTDAHYF